MVARGATAVTVAVHILRLPLSTSLSSALEVRLRVLSLWEKSLTDRRAKWYSSCLSHTGPGHGACVKGALKGSWDIPS